MLINVLVCLFSHVRGWSADAAFRGRHCAASARASPSGSRGRNKRPPRPRLGATAFPRHVVHNILISSPGALRSFSHFAQIHGFALSETPQISPPRQTNIAPPFLLSQRNLQR